jgi:hypothetical protein
VGKEKEKKAKQCPNLKDDPLEEKIDFGGEKHWTVK